MQARLGPHGSPGDATHRPETPEFHLRRSLTASRPLGLLERHGSSP